VRFTVVGSGASAVHFARSLLEAGHEVEMLDVGLDRPDPIRPEDSFEGLKRNLDDPVTHFLGEDFESVTWPGEAGEYYGFPPNKRHVFARTEDLRVEAKGFAPLLSFACGGLSEAWTGGAFPFSEGELVDFPFGWDELHPAYETVARRIGLTGERDDLVRHFPWHEDLLPPLDLDEHSRLLLEGARRHRDWLERELGCTIGRSRTATLSRDLGDRKACGYLGRCLGGCPTDSLWTPRSGLLDCRRFPGFRYRPGLRVRSFDADAAGLVRSVECERIDGGGRETVPVERLALAAGTLATGKIFLESWRRRTGEDARLGGLMDNRQVLLPFLNLRMIGRAHDPETYQYHQIALGLAAADPRDYVHGLVTTLKTASIHPIVPSLPFDLRTSLGIFRNVHAALGLVNVNFPDRRRDACGMRLGAAAGDEEPPLLVDYVPPSGEAARLRAATRRVTRALRKLGCLVPPGMSHRRPMGASVHYSGTLPMAASGGRFTTTPDGRSRDFENLWIVDGSTFPFLPAKNLTFTLMANAVRMAESISGSAP
jgi:choline dehydrogenase-like flavoprotein